MKKKQSERSFTAVIRGLSAGLALAVLAGCGQATDSLSSTADNKSIYVADQSQVESKAKKPSTKVPTAQGFLIDLFSVVVVEHGTAEVTNNLLGGTYDVTSDVRITYDAAFSMECVATARPRKGQPPCSNTRPNFELEIYASNGGAEISLGRQAIAGENIAFRGIVGYSGAVVRQSVLLDLAKAQTLLSQAGTAPLALRAEARVQDPAVGSGTFPSLATLGPHLWPQMDSLGFGGVLTAVVALSVGESCGSDQWMITGSTRVAATEFTFDQLCVGVDTELAQLSVISGSANGGQIATQVGTLSAMLGDVVLDANGATAASVRVELPSRVLAHPGSTYRPLGSDYLQLTSSTLDGELQIASGQVSSPVWLSSEGLPLVVRVDSLSIDNEGLKGPGAAIAYLHRQRQFTGTDSRGVDLKRQDLAMGLPGRARYLHSNDILFSAPGLGTVINGGATQVTIRQNGLDVSSLRFSAGSGGGHFPVASRDWAAFNGEIKQGRLQTTSNVSDQGMRIFPSADCGECSQPVVPGDVYPDPMGVSFEEVGMNSNGAVGARGRLNRGAQWGPKTANDRRVFERDDQGASAVVYAPGYRLENTAEQESLAPYLLGGRELTQSGSGLGLGPIHNADSSESVAGNHFFAGINVGPQWLRDAGNQPQVGAGSDPQGSKTYIHIGNPQGPASIEQLSNMGTKYVQRAGGVTGVFQGQGTSETEIYGYPFKLTRLGFRVVRNQLDSYTWIDGAVAVPAPAGLEVAFRSLVLNCDGSVRGGIVEPGLCDSSAPGPNCGLRLAAWKSKTDVLGMRFVPEDDQLSACAVQDRVLSLDQTVLPLALDRPLGLIAEWTSRGEMRDAVIRGSTNVTVERNADHKGFRLALGREGIRMPVGTGAAGSEAWFEFDDVSMAVPFWESLAPRMRLGNQSLNSALPSVLGAGAFSASATNAGLAAQLASLQTASDVTARYQWGATPFEMTPKVFYRSLYLPGGAEDGPQWLGRTYQEDLYVMKLNAGVDYIRPEFTSLSFGASADFARLRDLNLDLNIDLLDPSSVKQLDDWFHRYLSVRPFGNALAPLTQYLDPLSQFTGPQMEALTESLLELGLDQALSTLPSPLRDPFELLSERLAAVQALPVSIVGQVVDPIRDEVKGLEATLGDAVEQTFLAAVGPLVQGAAEINALLVELQTADARRADEIRAEIAAIQTGMHTPLESLKGGVLARINEVNLRIEQMEGLTQQQGQRLQAVRDQLVVDMGFARDAIESLDSVIAAWIPDQTCGFQDPMSAFSAAALFAPASAPPISVPDWGGAPFDFTLQSPEFGSLPSVDPNAFTRPIAAVGQTMQNLATTMTQLQALAGTLSTIAQSAGGVSQNVQQTLTNLRDRSGNLANEINGRVAAIQDVGLCDLPAQAFLAPLQAEIQRYRDLLIAFETGAVDAVNQYETFLNSQAASFPAVPGMPQEVADVRAQIQQVEGYIAGFVEYIEKLADDPNISEPVPTEWGSVLTSPADVLGEFNRHISRREQVAIGLVGAGGSNLISHLRQEVFAPMYQALNILQGLPVAMINARLAAAGFGDALPSFSEEELRREVLRLLMKSQGAEQILAVFNDNFAELLDELDGLVLSVVGQLNVAVKEVVSRVEQKINAALASATAQVEGLAGRLGAGKLDGSAVIRGNELHRAHVEAEFAVPGSDADSAWGFNAALDLESWNSNGKSQGCSAGEAASLLDATISTRDLPFSFGGDRIVADQIALRFTLQENLVPIALGGLVDTSGSINFQAFEVFDLAAAAGFGLTENYLGARAGAAVSGISAQAAFLAGETCNLDVLTALDPEAASFIGLSNKFVGAFARMSADIPIYDNGCALTVGARADVGSWALFHDEPTIGGVLGGGAFGRAACIAAIRGQITTYGQMSGSEFTFRGEGFGVAGAGLDCDPKTWTSVKRSRNDDWCGTGDAQFSATYRNGWDVGSPSVSAVH